MKKFIAVLLLVLLLTAVSVPPITAAEETAWSRETAFVLPKFLHAVEEEAFAGTAVETAVLPDSLGALPDRVFAGADALTDVFLPLTLGRIGQQAFPENEGLTVHAAKGSAAQRWASAHRMRFREDNSRLPPALAGRVVAHHRDDFGRLRRALPEERKITAVREDRTISMRPQDRPELYPIDYRFP